jgi:DNA-binding CsgD family transcriptional regulator
MIINFIKIYEEYSTKSIAKVVLSWLLLILISACSTPDEVDLTPKVCQEVNHFVADLSSSISDGKVIDLNNSLHHLDSLRTLYPICLDSVQLFEIHFMAGNYYYFLGLMDEAIEQFKEAKNNYSSGLSILHLAAIESNLGAAYLRKGYNRTAAKHLIFAKKIFQNENVRDENYYITLVNEAVAHMDRFDFERTKSILDLIKDNISDHVSLLKYLNLAKYNALNNNWQEFTTNMDLAKSYVERVPAYSDVLMEVQLEFGIKFKELAYLSKLLEEISLPYYKKSYLNIRLLSQHANFLVYQSMLNGFDELEQLEIEVAKSTNFSDHLNLINLKLEMYKDSTVQQYSRIVQERDSLRDVLLMRANNQEIKDFYEYSKLNDLNAKIEDLYYENELIRLQSSNKNYVIFLFSSITFFLFLTIVLTRKIYRKRREVEKFNLDMSELRLSNAKERELELINKLESENYRITEIFKQLSKLEILKKHIDSFLKEMDGQFNKTDQEKLKKLKINISSFYNNYAEIAILGTQKDELKSEVNDIENRLRYQLNENELDVTRLILQDFTSKEIAVLLGKTEKTIEYYRRKIRDKLNLDSEQDLKNEIKRIAFSP